MRIGTRLGLAAALLALLSGLAFAKPKKPKPPPPPPTPVDGGVIYYGYGLTVFEMNPDGSGKTAVIDQSSLEAYNYRPSFLPHDGERWFLVFQPISGEGYPSGKDRFELFAVTAAGDAVQLTDDPDIEPKFVGGFPDLPSWATHEGTKDGKVSFLATRWGVDSLGNDVVLEHGVYWVEVDPDDLLSHTAATYGAGGAFLPVAFGLSDALKMHAMYDWSPAGTAIVFVDTEVGPGLRKAEATSSWTSVQLTTSGESPKWSPAGDRIAYYVPADQDVYAIDTDGTDAQCIVSGRAGPPFWSPSGTHLVHWTGAGGTGPYFPRLDVTRITADGGDDTNLTGDIGGRPYPFAWCGG